MCRCDYRRGFGWDIGFTDHLYTPLGTKSKHSAIADLHKSQITTAPAKCFPACCVFTSRSIAAASNSGHSSASRASPLWTAYSPHRAPYRTDSVAAVAFLITPLHGPSIKHRSQQYLYCCMRILCRGNLFTEPLPRNECSFRAISKERPFLWLHSSCFQQICHNIFCTAFHNNPWHKPAKYSLFS
jgi:hypothetical protein